MEGLAAAHALTRLFRIANTYVNFFLPSFKLKEKIRIGAKIKKIYEAPATPCDRLLKNPRIKDRVKERLRTERKGLVRPGMQVSRPTQGLSRLPGRRLAQVMHHNDRHA